MLVGTKYDPATPYADAQALAGELADARLLTHEGYGHTALINPSSCVKTYESRYLVDGTLPPAGTTCRQDKPPFPAPKPPVAGWPAPSTESGPQPPSWARADSIELQNADGSTN